MLDVRPQNFLDWHLNDTIDSLNDLEGALWQWVMDGLIDWQSPERAAAAREGYAAWLKRNGFSAARVKQYTTPPDEFGRRPSLPPDVA